MLMILANAFECRVRQFIYFTFVNTVFYELNINMLFLSAMCLNEITFISK